MADVESRVWHIRSGTIDEIVRASDQDEAWAALRGRPVEEFGLLASAEPDENADPFLIRSSALMMRWGRTADAEALIALAVGLGLPDTRALDEGGS